MAQLISPARIPDRKKLFCSSDPCRISIGPTVFKVTKGNGRAGTLDLVEEDELVAHRPALAAELLRPPDAEPAVLAHPADRRTKRLAPFALRVERRADFVGQELGEVGPQLRPQRESAQASLRGTSSFIPPVPGIEPTTSSPAQSPTSRRRTAPEPCLPLVDPAKRRLSRAGVLGTSPQLHGIPGPRSAGSWGVAGPGGVWIADRRLPYDN